MRPPRPRMTRRSTDSNLISVADEADPDANYHYRLLSGQLSREKQARRAIMQKAGGSMMELRRAVASPSASAPSEASTAPLLTPAAAAAPTGVGTFSHSAVYRFLSGRSRRGAAVAFNRGLAVLIVLNVTAFVVESFPSFREPDSPYLPWFYSLEAVSSSIFLLEYFARVWTIPESRYYRMRYPSNPWKARLMYTCTIRAVVDLVSCAPFFLELMVPGQNLPTFTWIRSFRLFRILKSENSMRAFSSIYRVVWYNSEILSVALFIGLLLMMVTSTLLWYLPPPEDEEDDFSSIPATFYLSILMLTGQGTPAGELPWYTKVIVIVTAVFSVPIFVIPASMLTWGFEAEAERLMRRKREQRRREKLARVQGTEVASSSSSEGSASGSDSEESKEWDEYEDVVLGGAEAEGGGGGGGVSEEERKLIKDVAQFFSQADTDGSGHLSIKEFYQFHRDTLRRKRVQDTALPPTPESPTPDPQPAEERLERLERKLDDLAAAVARLQPPSA